MYSYNTKKKKKPNPMQPICIRFLEIIEMFHNFSQRPISIPALEFLFSANILN